MGVKLNSKGFVEYWEQQCLNHDYTDEERRIALAAWIAASNYEEPSDIEAIVYFGKYTGKSVRYILLHDPRYIIWLWRNCLGMGLPFKEDVYNIALSKIRKHPISTPTRIKSPHKQRYFVDCDYEDDFEMTFEG